MDILGIDISKDHFHAALFCEAGGSGKKSFPNSEAGFKQLDSWLHNRHIGLLHACMEATGPYWEALALHLSDTGHRVSVVNPSRTRSYARSELLRTKNDAVDAALIARFCRAQNPLPWTAPTPEMRRLQGLARHLEHLKTTCAHEMARLQLPGLPDTVQVSIRGVVTALEAEIAHIEDEIRRHVDGHPDLREKHQLLTSIPGIADITAFSILAEVPDLENFTSAKAVAAYAGLSPAERQSGTSLRPRSHLCKTGNARLRKTLFFPAMAAMRFNPALRAFAERMRANGKAKMVVLAAVMRKLLVLAYGVLKSRQAFDSAWQPA